MFLRDPLGAFEIIVDKDRRVVHEKLSGLFTPNDSARLEKAYRNNVVPYLGDGNWMKLCDMREYILNSSVGHQDVSYYIQRVMPYGFIGCAIIINSEKLTKHLSLAVMDIDAITFEYFTCEEDADDYLRSRGF